MDISMDIVKCTPLKCMPVKEVFQRLLGQLLPASSKNVAQKAIKLFVRHEQQHLDTCERCPEMRRTGCSITSGVDCRVTVISLSGLYSSSSGSSNVSGCLYVIINIQETAAGPGLLINALLLLVMHACP